MAVVRFLLALAAAALLHLLGSRISGHFPVVVDLFLVVALWAARSGHLTAAIAAGSAAGLVTDALTGGPFGLYAFADTIVAYATAFAARRLVIERAFGVFLLHAMAVAVQQAVILGLLRALSAGPSLPGLTFVGFRMLATGALGTLAAVGARRLERRWGRYRRGRRSKLRIGS